MCLLRFTFKHGKERFIIFSSNHISHNSKHIDDFELHARITITSIVPFKLSHGELSGVESLIVVLKFHQLKNIMSNS